MKISEIVYCILFIVGYAVCSILDQQPAAATSSVIVPPPSVEQGQALHVIGFNQVPVGTYTVTLRLDEGSVGEGFHKYLYKINSLSGEQFKVRFESNPEDALPIGAELEVFPNREILIVKN
jgi:hypothetical protein